MLKCDETLIETLIEFHIASISGNASQGSSINGIKCQHLWAEQTDSSDEDTTAAIDCSLW